MVKQPSLYSKMTKKIQLKPVGFNSIFNRNVFWVVHIDIIFHVTFQMTTWNLRLLIGNISLMNLPDRFRRKILRSVEDNVRSPRPI